MESQQVVPVEQMSLILLKTLQGGHRLAYSAYGLLPRQVSKIAGTQNAQHVKAYICGAGPGSQFVHVGKLVIIRRKPVGAKADELVEGSPGTPGYLS